MSHEIRATHIPGRTLTAKLFKAGVQVGSAIALAESAQAGYYTGAIPSGVAAGVYDALLFEGSTILDSRPLRWDGVQEELAVIPDPPLDTGVCRVYGYFENAGNEADVRETVSIRFTLRSASGGVIRSERIVAVEPIEATVDAQGRLLGPAGTLYVDLLRTNLVEPAGCKYFVETFGISIQSAEIELTTGLEDLRALLVAAV